ncbi:Shedu anti-phage system protein SduA domain-containing protein [uncultured Tateyamaria sp.]|uniref:Shedu anti-phage system protein SduA domain-containing protein n=1 Tax=uncultured Tateyamaria sp. TaxID=455651 RepID=UPI0026124DE0|nr:Shedu anti-phage system protein SduA domain-containing protein [uncultured Tateyamaria sp.]
MSTSTNEDLKSQYLSLLDEQHKEQVYQDFIEQHTGLIPRMFVQNHGVHFGLVLRKLPFGADYKSDFFFFSKSSIDWHAVLIEIEKPSSRYFKPNSNEISSEFQKAIHQIKTWEAWLNDQANAAGFLASLSTLQVPAHMARHPTTFKFILVHGRRAEIENSPQRKQLVKSYETPNFKIMSFDSLAENLNGNCALNIGVRHNEFIDVLGDEICDGQMVAWMEPTHLRVSKALHDVLKAGSVAPKQVSMQNGKRVDSWVKASETIRVRK